MDSSITLKPLTSAGAAWVKAYTHPPSAVSGVEGIPDHSTMSSTVVDFRNEFNITAPASGQTWSVLILAQANPRYPVLSWKWPDNSYASYSFEQNANPSFNWGTNATNWEANVQRFRPVKASITSYFDASSLYNQGKTYAAQVGQDRRLFTASAADNVETRYLLGVMPVNGGQIMQTSSKYYTGPASEGNFSILRYVDPSAQYADAAPVSASLNGTINGTAFDSDLGAGFQPPTYVGMSQAWHLYTGLLPQATLHCKMIHSYEVVTDVGSAWAPFCNPGPCPDGPAMELAAVEQYKLQDGFPSSANDLAAFWNAAKSLGPVLKGVWNVAKPALKTGLSTLPGGGLMNQVVDAVENLALTQTPRGNSKKKGKGPKPNQSQQQMQGLTKAQKKRQRAKQQRKETIV
jgi:hypothetical protein